MSHFCQLPECAAVLAVLGSIQFSEQQIKRTFLAEFKTSKPQESQGKHVEAAKIYREELSHREKQ